MTTKRGDGGEAVAISGDTYPKSHVIMECCGNVDMLRAHIALCRLLVVDSGHKDANSLAEFLFWILHTCFLLGSHFSDPLNKHPEYRRQDLAQRQLDKLEKKQAELEAEISFDRGFVVSASNVSAAQLDVACTIARQLERSAVRLKETFPEFDTRYIFPFLNRLSDCLFVLARFLDNGKGITLDYGALKD